MEKISRSGFLKLAAAAAMSGVTAGALTACNNSASSSTAAASGAAVYTPGTYTAKATGMGEVTVSMTFTENAITDVTVDTANETIDLARNSAEDFQKALLDAQSAEIDGRFRCHLHLHRREGSRRQLHPAGHGRGCRGPC